MPEKNKRRLLVWGWICLSGQGWCGGESDYKQGEWTVCLISSSPGIVVTDLTLFTRRVNYAVLSCNSLASCKSRFRLDARGMAQSVHLLSSH